MNATALLSKASAAPATSAAPEIDPEKLARVLTTVHAQLVTALWLSAGMLLAFAAIVCMAFRLRRSALACGFCYSATLFFVHNGHAQILAPAGCAVALIGLLWPQKSSCSLRQSPGSPAPRT
jgi:hypothetical protein